MCGIVGAVGKSDVMPILLDGLKRLEYRGYDSAGIAILQNGGIEIRRDAGKLAVLSQLVQEQPVSGNLGIGHTRWATHGEPNARFVITLPDRIQRSQGGHTLQDFTSSPSKIGTIGPNGSTKVFVGATLLARPGLTGANVDVDFDAKLATVTIDPDKFDEKGALAKLDGAGYPSKRAN